MGALEFEWRGDQRTSGDNFDHDEDDIYGDDEGDIYDDDDDDDDADPLGRFEFKQVTGGTWCGNGISAADGHTPPIQQYKHKNHDDDALQFLFRDGDDDFVGTGDGISIILG